MWGRGQGGELRDEMNKILEGVSGRVLRKIWGYRNPIPPPLQPVLVLVRVYSADRLVTLFSASVSAGK